MVIFLLVAFNCHAEMIGDIQTSGLLIKDSLEIHAFDDPDIKGVTCYVTMPKRTLSFEDQTDSCISCRKVGEIKEKLISKKEIFKAKKSWFIKSLCVDRIYDKVRNTLVYISYTRKISGDNANNSISVVPLNK